MALDVVETLCSLVAIPSVNPMGRDDTGDEFYEYRMTDRLEEIFRSIGLPWERQQIAPKRSNIMARLDGGNQLLVFEAHQDTVPVDGMTIPPWEPTVRDGAPQRISAVHAPRRAMRPRTARPVPARHA